MCSAAAVACLVCGARSNVRRVCMRSLLSPACDRFVVGSRVRTMAEKSQTRPPMVPGVGRGLRDGGGTRGTASVCLSPCPVFSCLMLRISQPLMYAVVMESVDGGSQFDGARVGRIPGRRRVPVYWHDPRLPVYLEERAKGATGREAAVRAGWSESSAKVICFRIDSCGEYIAELARLRGEFAAMREVKCKVGAARGGVLLGSEWVASDDDRVVAALDESDVGEGGVGGITREAIIRRLVGIAETATKSEKFGDAIKALHLIGKDMGMWPEAGGVNVEVNVGLAEVVAQARKRLIESYPEGAKRLGVGGSGSVAGAGPGVVDGGAPGGAGDGSSVVVKRAEVSGG